MPPTVGQVIHNKYRLLRHLGDGGMGSVYEARHETLGTTVALKFLHLELSRRDGLVERFLQEARASARIQSPHVVRVDDVDFTPDGDVFIVLEYLEGKTLQALYEELYRGGRRLSYAEALDYTVQMLDGVEAAHQAGIVHRDLKPDNVMITADGKGATVVKLLDFGIAKLKAMGGSGGSSLTRPGVMMGTPEYMAPEQVTSADLVDARADVFSLGVLIFEMLAGQRPVGGDDARELAAAHRNGQIARLVDLVPGIAPELCAAVHRAMAADPRDRFATAAELCAAVEPFAAAVRAPTPSRVRAGGTIGVSEVALSGVRGAAPAAPPPPTAGDAVSMGTNPARVSSSEAVPMGTSPPNPGTHHGVAKTWPPDAGPEVVPSPGPARGNSTVVDDGSSAALGDHTRLMNDVYSPGPAPRLPEPFPPPASMAAPSAPRPGRRRRRNGLSPLGVVAIAASAACLVVGGIYLASRGSSSAKERDEDPPPITMAPSSPSAEPTPAEPHPAEPPPPAEAPPAVPRQRHRPRSGPGPGTPPGPPGQLPKAVPSSVPSALPSAPPPGLVLPFPIPNPFQGAPQAPGSGVPNPPDPPLFPLP